MLRERSGNAGVGVPVGSSPTIEMHILLTVNTYKESSIKKTLPQHYNESAQKDVQVISNYGLNCETSHELQKKKIKQF